MPPTRETFERILEVLEKKLHAELEPRQKNIPTGRPALGAMPVEFLMTEEVAELMMAHPNTQTGTNSKLGL